MNRSWLWLVMFMAVARVNRTWMWLVFLTVYAGLCAVEFVVGWLKERVEEQLKGAPAHDDPGAPDEPAPED